MNTFSVLNELNARSKQLDPDIMNRSVVVPSITFVTVSTGLFQNTSNNSTESQFED